MTQAVVDGMTKLSLKLAVNVRCYSGLTRAMPKTHKCALDAICWKDDARELALRLIATLKQEDEACKSRILQAQRRIKTIAGHHPYPKLITRHDDSRKERNPGSCDSLTGAERSDRPCVLAVTEKKLSICRPKFRRALTLCPRRMGLANPAGNKVRMGLFKGFKRMVSNTGRIDRSGSDASESISAPASSPSPEVSPSGQVFTGRASQDQIQELNQSRSKARQQLAFEASPQSNASARERARADGKRSTTSQRATRPAQKKQTVPDGAFDSDVVDRHSNGSSRSGAEARWTSTKPTLAMHADSTGSSRPKTKDAQPPRAQPSTGGQRYFKEEPSRSLVGAQASQKSYSPISGARISSVDMMDSWQTSSPTSDVSAHALSNLDRSTLEDSPLQPVIGSSSSRSSPAVGNAAAHQSWANVEAHVPVNPDRVAPMERIDSVGNDGPTMSAPAFSTPGLAHQKPFIGELPLPTHHQSRRSLMPSPQTTAVLMPVRDPAGNSALLVEGRSANGRLQDISGQAHAQKGAIKPPEAPVAAQKPEAPGRSKAVHTDYSRSFRPSGAKSKRLKSEPWDQNLLTVYDSQTLTSVRGDDHTSSGLRTQDDFAVPVLSSQDTVVGKVSLQRSFTRDRDSQPRFGVPASTSAKRLSPTTFGRDSPRRSGTPPPVFATTDTPALPMDRQSPAAQQSGDLWGSTPLTAQALRSGSADLRTHGLARASWANGRPSSSKWLDAAGNSRGLHTDPRGANPWASELERSRATVSTGSKHTRTSQGWLHISPPSSLSSEADADAFPAQAPMEPAVGRLPSEMLTSFGARQAKEGSAELMSRDTQAGLSSREYHDLITRRLQYGDQFGHIDGKEDSAYKRKMNAFRNIGTRDTQFPSIENAGILGGQSDSKGVIAFLQGKLGALEDELLEVSKQNLVILSERDTALRIQQIMDAELTEAKTEISGMQELLVELRADLKESQGDKKWGANEASMALLEAQQEALAQEEAAELARGELDEFKRRFQAEIQHARNQARLGLPSHQAEVAKKKAELDRALSNAERVRQERDTLAEMVATRNDSEARLRDLVDSLQAGKREQDKSHADLLAIKDQELSSLREDLEGAMEEKDIEIAALVRDHQERIVAHSGELEELSTAHRQELSDCKAQLEEETGELYDQLSDLQAKVDALTAESCDLNTQLAEVRSQLEDSASAAPRTQPRASKPSSLFDSLDSDFEVNGVDLTLESKLGGQDSARLHELQSKLEASEAETTRLQGIEALATEALEALELQTAEALRLRSLSDRLQEAMMLIEEKQAKFVEYE